MNDKAHVEISDFHDWRQWVVTGERMEAYRWMEQNKDMWVLFWLKFVYRENVAKALEKFEIYSNASDKSEQFKRVYNDYVRVLDRGIELLEEKIAEQARDRLESGSNGKNSEVLGVGVCDPDDRG